MCSSTNRCSLEEAALDLGATEYGAFRRVTLPYLGPAIAAAARRARAGRGHAGTGPGFGRPGDRSSGSPSASREITPSKKAAATQIRWTCGTEPSCRGVSAAVVACSSCWADRDPAKTSRRCSLARSPSERTRWGLFPCAPGEGVADHRCHVTASFTAGLLLDSAPHEPAACSVRLVSVLDPGPGPLLYASVRATAMPRRREARL